MEESRLLGLPDELLLDIVSWMAPEDQANMKLICREMWTLYDWPIMAEFLKIPDEKLGRIEFIRFARESYPETPIKAGEEVLIRI
jgi:hypothetical protein